MIFTNSVFKVSNMCFVPFSYNLVSVCSVFSSASVIGRIPNLKYLKAAGNELCNVPSLLGLFPQLKELRLEHNSMRERDLEQLLSLRNLRSLNLAHNKIRSIPGIFYDIILLVVNTSVFVERVAQYRTFENLVLLDLGNGLCTTNKVICGEWFSSINMEIFSEYKSRKTSGKL